MPSFEYRIVYIDTKTGKPKATGTYQNRMQADNIAAGYRKRTGLGFLQRRVMGTKHFKREKNPMTRRGPNPRGKTPPHLKKYLFKKGHR
jgi:hypothetical protein